VVYDGFEVNKLNEELLVAESCIEIITVVILLNELIDAANAY
jgi:hypothetical protein